MKLISISAPGHEAPWYRPFVRCESSRRPCCGSTPSPSSACPGSWASFAVDKKPHVPLTGCWWVAVLPSANNENELQFDELSLSADGFICPSSVLKLLGCNLQACWHVPISSTKKKTKKNDMFPNPYISLAAAQHWRWWAYIIEIRSSDGKCERRWCSGSLFDLDSKTCFI